MSYKLNKFLYTKTIDDVVLIKNLLNNKTFAIAKEKYMFLQSDNLNAPTHLNSNFFNAMKKLEVIVPNEFDELSLIKMRNRTNVFSNKKYRLTINPTLECNFNCWYCYEEHTPGKMTQDTCDAIVKHIKLQIDEMSMKHLELDWFGGEPLMYFDEVVHPLLVRVKLLCDENGIMFTSGMTTNGYFINEERIELFKKLGVQSFQITLDGNQKRHDKIRFNKGRIPSFETIVSNINKLAERIENVNILLRVNYTEKTLVDINEIITYFSEKAKEKITLLFQQVWQDSMKKYTSAESNVKEFEKNGFKVNRHIANARGNVCYADLISQAVINFDGRVFKCTARDFNNTKEDGVLLDDGEIIWDKAYLAKRLGTATFENKHCLTCNLLPVCMGPCSQKMLEFNEETDDFRRICLVGGVTKSLDMELDNYYTEKVKNECV